MRTGDHLRVDDWQYDNADKITKSPYASAYTYDAHGNTTATTGTSGNPSAAITYDANDQATVVNDGTTTITETLSPSGRVLRRVVTTNAGGAVTEDTSYGYSSSGDSPAYSRPTTGSTATSYLLGLGGLTDVGGTATWSIYDGHGNVQGITNAAGTLTAAPTADEFGVGTTPASRLGWLGQQQRPSVGGNLGLVRMGVRLYDPKLGRFLEVDPVEGGSVNDYAYGFGDPINGSDLGGDAWAVYKWYWEKPPKEIAENDILPFWPAVGVGAGGHASIGGQYEGTTTVYRGTAIRETYICWDVDDCKLFERDRYKVEVEKTVTTTCWGIHHNDGGDLCYHQGTHVSYDIDILGYLGALGLDYGSIGPRLPFYVDD